MIGGLLNGAGATAGAVVGAGATTGAGWDDDPCGSLTGAGGVSKDICLRVVAVRCSWS